MASPWALYGALGCLAALYSALPVLVNGWTLPPANDTDNLAKLGFPWLSPIGYYGHYPAWLIGYTWYYYLTPLLTLAGFFFCFRRYGPVTVALTWGAAWLLSGVLIYDMQRATFIGIVGIYGLGLPLVRLSTRWNTGVVLLAMGLPLFHAFSGMAWGAGMGLYSLLSRRQFFLRVAVVVAVGVFISGFALQSSVLQALFLPHVLIHGAMPSGWDFIGAIPIWRFTVCEGCRPAFLSYFGTGGMLFLGVAAEIMWISWRKGWRPKSDPAIITIAWTLLPLSVMTFTPLAINADRTAKVLAAMLLILAAVALVSCLKHLHSQRATLIAGSLTAVAFGLGAMLVIPLWLECGR